MRFHPVTAAVIVTTFGLLCVGDLLRREEAERSRAPMQVPPAPPQIFRGPERPIPYLPSGTRGKTESGKQKRPAVVPRALLRTGTLSVSPAL